MTDDRIGTIDNPPKLTIGGFPVEKQFRFRIGIGNGRYVIVGHDDNNYQDEIKHLKSGKSKPPVRIHKQRAINEQAEDESDSN